MGRFQRCLQLVLVDIQFLFAAWAVMTEALNQQVSNADTGQSADSSHCPVTDTIAVLKVYGQQNYNSIPKAKTPLSLKGRSEVLQEQLRGPEARGALLSSIDGMKSLCTLLDQPCAWGGTATTWKTAHISPVFTKVPTEGSPHQEDMAPSQNPFLV